MKLKIIIGSTRPGRVGPVVARWVDTVAREFGKFDVDLVDLAEVNLPLLDEPAHPRLKQYTHDHTKRWSAIVEEADAIVFVTPEYDYFPPASIINAVQCLLLEWAKKPVGIVSYGGVSGGLRSTQMLRLLLGNVGAVPLSRSVPIPFVPQFIKDGVLQPNEPMIEGANGLLADLHDWAESLKTMRDKAAAG